MSRCPLANPASLHRPVMKAWESSALASRFLNWALAKITEQDLAICLYAAPELLRNPARHSIKHCFAAEVGHSRMCGASFGGRIRLPGMDSSGRRSWRRTRCRSLEIKSPGLEVVTSRRAIYDYGVEGSPGSRNDLVEPLSWIIERY